MIFYVTCTLYLDIEADNEAEALREAYAQFRRTAYPDEIEIEAENGEEANSDENREMD